MVIKILLIILGAFAAFQIAFRIFRKLFHFPAPAFMGRLLDSKHRRRAQPPGKVIQRSGIKEGMRVLDLGCGSGALTTFAARAVGENGMVYALDIESKMLKQLENKLKKDENRDIRNVQPVQSSAYNLPFEREFFDLAYMVAVLQEIPDRMRALSEIKRVLRPGGILAVTELLPDPDYPLRSTTIKMVKKAGFVLDQAFGNFWSYTVRFIKPETVLSAAQSDVSRPA
ncbi:MAG: methyltransferase domain-containing protein [Candidatus Zixiibacteriota bacterium]